MLRRQSFWFSSRETALCGTCICSATATYLNHKASPETRERVQYLRAVGATGGTDAKAVIGHLRGATLNDVYVRNGRIRADGTMLHDMYLLRVKAPDRSTGPWDVYDLVATVPGAEAFPDSR